MKIKVIRYHDISCGHRVVGHENKCRFLHGHNYRITFHCEAEALDDLGRVIDFGAIKTKLCMWLEDNWDHKFLAWEQDALISSLRPKDLVDQWVFKDSIVFLPFNPTAENMARYLLTAVCPTRLWGTGVVATRVEIEETRKCSASCDLSGEG